MAGSKRVRGVVKFFGRKLSVLYHAEYQTDWLVAAALYERCGYDKRKELLRKWIETDLFFVVYFVLGIESANHPWVIERCKEVQEGPRSHTLDIWAREHFKSSIITVAETIQDVLKNPEERIGIYSYAREPARRFLSRIKREFENTQLL